jgi:predicted metal-dependent phosphoesterase TrpH
MRRLKADFHTHTADDPYDRIQHSAEQLIDAVALAGVQVLAITCHDARVYSEQRAGYARDRGVLLIPGVERQIEGRHVLLLNPSETQMGAQTFAELRRIGRGASACIAPHPYYPIGCSLREKLCEHIDLFDAIEISSFYCCGCNLNRKAARIAAQYQLPLVGNSDTHLLPYCDSTFTWIDAEPTLDGVIHAIRMGRTRVVTRPRPWLSLAQMLCYAARGSVGRKKAPSRRCLRQGEEVG